MGRPRSAGPKLGHKSGSFLSQLAGPNPSREVTEHTARGVERALDLPLGWMDQQHRGEPSEVDSGTLGQVVQLVGELVQTHRVKLSPDKFADLVSLVYDDLQVFGSLREGYVRRLLKLIA